MLVVSVLASHALRAPIHPRVDYTEGVALGIDTHPRFSWAPVSDKRAEEQEAYQLVVTQHGGKIIWDSNRTRSNQTQFVPLPASVSIPRDSEFDWSVRWWPASAPETPSDWRTSSFSTGIGSGSSMKPWRGANWIVAGKFRGQPGMSQLRKSFSLSTEPRRAALYVACMGYFSVSVDGVPASQMMLGDFTNFEKRLWYTTFNITSYLQQARRGQNGTLSRHALGLTLSGGWDSRHGSGKNGNSILVLLSVDNEQGHTDIVSDTSWRSGIGPMTEADIYQGETFNASRVTTGWDTGDFNETASAAAAGGYAYGYWTNCTVGAPPHKLTKHPWSHPSIIASHAPLPQIEITGSVSPVDFWAVPGTSNSSWVFDFGVNRAAVTTLTIPANIAQALGENATWTQQAAEALACAKPCAINHFPAQGANEILKYVSDPALNSKGGSAAIDWTPKFTQFGFRYIQLNFTASPTVAGATAVAGAWAPDVTTLTMQFINTAAAPISTIDMRQPTSSTDIDGDVGSGLLNKIQAMTATSGASNFMSIPTDCPQRAERLGWMGDAYTSGESQLHNFDLVGAYDVWLEQIEDNMDDNTTSPHFGGVPDCVPFYGGHCHLPSSPSWGSAYPTLAYWVYHYYGDTALVTKHYDKVKLYVDSLTARARAADVKNHTLLDTGGWGDWCAPTGNVNKTGCGGTGTCGGSYEYISALRTVVKFATRLGNSEDVAAYTALETKVVNAFVDAYYNDENKNGNESETNNVHAPPKKLGFSCGQTTAQTANALGLQVRPGDSTALSQLVADVASKQDHLDTGIVGTKHLFESLAQEGRADVALRVITNPTYPGYGFWVSQGATSLWETWEGTRYHPHSSWNHVMFGSTSEFFFRHLAGIQQPRGSYGYKKVVFWPSILLTPVFLSVCGNLTSVRATMTRPIGNITSSWSCTTTSSSSSSSSSTSWSGLSFNVSTPVGVPSVLRLPVSSEGGKIKVTELMSGRKVVWDGAMYVAGVDGVEGAELVTGGSAVDVHLGSGEYAFATSISFE